MYLQRVKEAIKAIRNGEMIIIMDDEDRENEGDLVYAGIFTSPEKINFMTKYARGLVCVSITEDIAKKLDLSPMVKHNDSNHETAFTVSIDSKTAKTGISAFERSETIRLMCEETTEPSDFVRPGHIFPLIAKKGGVLIRTGHTEASIDICKLAGLKPVSVICEIMKDDGSMPGHGDKFLSDFAKEFNLKILYVSDLVHFRLEHECLLTEISNTEDNFLGKACKKYEFKDHLNNIHTAYEFTPKNSIPLVKIHRITPDLELFQDETRYKEMIKSVDILQEKGGFLIFINAYSPNDVDKRFGTGAQILRLLDIKEFDLLSNKEQSFNSLHGFNLNLRKRVEI
ncbi:bifunctional 3,4-dihydroxy-2-butanone 4-phosphate synthase/GTP cyclohydrolase II [Helicobacter sp. 13S00401-1]|uniref:bifunctional 3,4-dihydroxy-2-butanone 4-phosphate synthase/GTP cyclohydrolase II n=1 Tax=Helicobacter sp. 13S00401-1 TaxID=1905758 RepID=UPI000BA59824|nr:bifunctional 3,4-dihydroxy-2-butanone 4-phosphate synthase/GTP cyclohydrolase II [Helicobacter sp. 13S00401-1]PAF49662.1 bifunctional 3,4-dihydroxy-2-butanone 4-phosphate synthase/GTP cyclohydrolase II [Helicobacter sp. 13S00401-1]